MEAVATRAKSPRVEGFIACVLELSYKLAAHGGLMVTAFAQNFPIVTRPKWHTKGVTKHFDS
jgi:hypothetical protein